MSGINPYYDFYLLTGHSNAFNTIVTIILFALIIIGIYAIASALMRRSEISSQVQNLANNAIEMTPEQFMRMRNTRMGRGKYALTMNYPGVYILHNKTKNLYYVGQGKQVLNRVNAHFTGHGNGDVYADYKYGDQFTIRTIKLQGSGFSNLNDLERYCIRTYNAYSRGYNRTRGNKSNRSMW